MLSLDKPDYPTEKSRDASWKDYIEARDRTDWQKISFNQGWLKVDMGKEGPNHTACSDLLTMIFGFWAAFHPDIPLQSYGRCLIEHPELQACPPDLVLYKGNDIPKWQPGEPRQISTTKHRLPDLVGEISDTTLSLDLDEQKQLYAALGINEYWVVDVRGRRIFAFELSKSGVYEPIETSLTLDEMAIALIEQTIERLEYETNTAAANWLMQQFQAQNYD